jgi:hypothetical protein
MAHEKTKQYEDELLKVIQTKKIAFFDHCFAFTTFSRATAYNHGLDKLDTIKAAIDNNRVSAKNYMLNKWIASDNATLQISAFRLLSNSEEHKKLNQQYIDHSNEDGTLKPQPQIIVADQKTKEELTHLLNDQSKTD